MRYLDIKKRKFNIVKDVQSKGHVNSCKVLYHLPKISEKGFERFKEKYIAIQIHHPLIMQNDIYLYPRKSEHCQRCSI